MHKDVFIYSLDPWASAIAFDKTERGKEPHRQVEVEWDLDMPITGKRKHSVKEALEQDFEIHNSTS